MPKHHSSSSKRRSGALRRLDPYNKSPYGKRQDVADDRHDDREANHNNGCKSKSKSRSKSPEDPPVWAQQLLKQQQSNATELQRLQKEVERSTMATASASRTGKKSRAPEPVFRYSGNKRQYEVNQNVLEKIEEAMEEKDSSRQQELLQEGKQLLLDRSKHILLADKYGWDTVECYTADPLASNAEDEKRIKKAVKESKMQREEKKKKSTSHKPVSWNKRSSFD